jgi:hypothetical protein
MATNRVLPAIAAGLTVLLAGCAIAARAVGQIILKVGTDVAVQVGSDYLEKLISPDDANGKPTIIVSYRNATGDGVGTNYAVTSARKISTTDVTIKDFKGDVHIVADGNGIAITVGNGSAATVAIDAGGGGARAASGAGDQAATVNGILAWSGRSRQALFGALDDLGACRNADGATAALQTVASDRDRQVGALAGVDVSALPGGGSLRSTLIRALKYSAQADRAFVRWGQSPGCGKDGNYRDGMRYSRSASATKRQFVGDWNPLAASYGLPQLREPDI